MRLDYLIGLSRRISISVMRIVFGTFVCGTPMKRNLSSDYLSLPGVSHDSVSFLNLFSTVFAEMQYCTYWQYTIVKLYNLAI